MKISNLFLILAFTLSQFHVSSQSLCDQYINMPIDITISDTNASNLNPDSLIGKHILLDGKVTLDQDLILKDCVIRVPSNGHINASSSFNNEEVTLENVKVYSCTGSIANFVRTGFFEDTGRPRLTVRNCVFENFLELFHITGGQYDIRNSTFQNPEPWSNHIIHIPFHNIFDEDLRPMHFSGNTFKDIQRVFTIEHSNNILIGSNSRLKNTFINCGFGGAGVFEYAGGTGVGVFQDLHITNNEFINCNSVVKGGRGLVALINNDFVDTEKAVTGGGKNFYAVDNTFEVSGNQNAMFLDKSSDNATLRDNEITYYSAPWNVGAVGIRTSGGGNTYAYGNKFKNYDLNNNYIGNQSFFLLASSNNRVVARENISEGGMIGAQGINNIEFYDNEVNARGSRHAFVNSLSNGKLCNNIGKDATFIYSFLGNCMNTDFNNNEIGSTSAITSGNGLFVDQVFGQQSHKANLWHGTFTNEGATNTSNFPLFSLITVNSDLGTGGNPLFKPANNSYTPIEWFDEDQNTSSFADCTLTYLIDPNDPNDPRKNLTFVDEKVIDGTFNLSTLSNWVAVRNLIRKLDNYPGLLNNLNANSWYNAMQNTSVADIASVENLLAIYYGDEVEVDNIRDLIEDYIFYSDELDQMESSNSNYQVTFDSYNTVRADIEAIQNQIEVRQVVIRSDVNNILVSLSPTNDFETIFKDVYTIYVKTLADSDYILQNIEIQVISEASNLCPLTFGPSIYIAQNIAKSYDINYDESNCSDIRTRDSKETLTNDVRIFPNPASDFITIQSSIDNSTITIYDTHMIEVISTNSSKINISNLTKGLYTVVVQSEDGSSTPKRLIVIK